MRYADRVGLAPALHDLFWRVITAMDDGFTADKASEHRKAMEASRREGKRTGRTRSRKS